MVPPPSCLACVVEQHTDDDGLFGSLDYRPSAIHAPDALREIWSWDSGAFVVLGCSLSPCFTRTRVILATAMPVKDTIVIPREGALDSGPLRIAKT